MLLKSRILRVGFVLSFVLSLSLAAFADTIRLKDGSVIKGRVVNFRDGQFVVVIGDGARQRQMTFFSDEIETIEFESNTQPANTAKTNNPNPNNTTTTRPTPTPVPTVRPTPENPVNSDNDVKIVVGKTEPNKTGNPQTASPKANPPATIGSANQTNTQTNNPPYTNNTNPPPPPRPKPIQLNLKVLADNTANGWTNAGWVVRKGQKIRITAKGQISLGSGTFSTPAGIASLADKDKLMQKEATGGLIAVIGDDNNDFIFIGASKEFVAARDGALFLGINEGVLDDNSGSFDVTIEIDPTTGN